MTIAEIEELCTRYAALVQRAVYIANNHPRGGWCGLCDDEHEMARVHIDGGEAVLSWPDSEYESSSIDMESSRFDASLLALDDATLEADIRSHREAEERRLAAERAASAMWAAVDQEIKEREILARLQAKYGSAS